VQKWWLKIKFAWDMNLSNHAQLQHASYMKANGVTSSSYIIGRLLADNASLTLAFTLI
jgi:hypothetical protein